MKSAKGQVREDWTNMSLSDWMDVTPSEWLNQMMATWQKSYGDYLSARPSDWWAMMYRQGAGPGAPAPGVAERRHVHPRRGAWDDDDECRKGDPHIPGCRHGAEPCECYCCLGDVDVAIYSHVGEQRVYQIVIENERHRDKQISLELSGWTTRGGSAAPVDTVLLEPKTFTIPSCGEQKVTLIVRVRAADQPGGDQPPVPVDVDDCLIAIADLRMVGCDHRPLRIAVAVQPRDCDPYRVDCGCACC